MKILIIDTFYGPYLKNLYSENNQGFLAKKPWIEQNKAHFAGGFGTGNSYSHELKELGVEAIEIVANSVLLQQRWAHEYQPRLLEQQTGPQQLFAILEAQIRWFRPTVLYVQDINWLPAAFINFIKPLVQIVVGQNACPLASNLDLKPYDLLLTSLPHYVGKFQARGAKAAYFPIGFDERLLQRHRTDGSRNHPLTFVGGLGGYHSKGTRMLEAIAKNLPLQVWGYGGGQLPIDSILKDRWQGEAWAEDMYRLLANSQITINRHIDIAEGYANNMRLYEATGMGACLLTDAKLNLTCLFEPDLEVVTYATPDEAVSKLKQLIKQPEAAASIAARGQARTLKHHTYRERMFELVDLLKKHQSETGSPSPQIPKQQTILVACQAEKIKYIPQKIRKSLLEEHKHHQILLITDADPKMKELQGMKRWYSTTMFTDKTENEPCLDAMKPDQIVIVDELPSSSDERDWRTQLKHQAERMKIVSTFVRPRS